MGDELMKKGDEDVEKLKADLGEFCFFAEVCSLGQH